MTLLPRTCTFLALSALLMLSCNDTPSPFPLEGSWSATSLIVSDSIWEVETSPVSLDLGEDGHYHLLWYGNRSETGKWHVDHPRLIIKPKDQKSRSMEILYVGVDSLALQGRVDDQRTVLAFKRHDQGLE